MADPINPRLSGEELLERILRENPHLTREVVLAVAASAGFDLLETGQAEGVARRNTATATR